MPTSAFPAALDAFASIGANTFEDAEGAEHDVVHQKVHNALAALQIKVGIDESEDPTSLDGRVSALEAAPLHYRRDDLTATAGDQVITLAATPHQGAVMVYQDGLLLGLADHALSGTEVTLGAAATGGEVYAVMYWTREAEPGASSIGPPP